MAFDGGQQADGLALCLFITSNWSERVGVFTNWGLHQSLGFSPMPELVKTPMQGCTRDKGGY